MAAPANKTLKDLSGQWTLNKTLSESPDPALVIQGLGYMLRTAISYASICITVEQYVAPPKPPHESSDPFTHIDIEQSASGLTSTRENRCLDNHPREHTDWLFGTVVGRSAWVKLPEVEDAYLKGGWEDSEGEFILSHVDSVDNGWTADQVWGFQQVEGERRYCRKVVVAKGSSRAEFRLVYDFVETDEDDE